MDAGDCAQDEGKLTQTNTGAATSQRMGTETESITTDTCSGLNYVLETLPSKS
jgi:hypothetical protein